MNSWFYNTFKSNSIIRISDEMTTMCFSCFHKANEVYETRKKIEMGRYILFWAENSVENPERAITYWGGRISTTRKTTNLYSRAVTFV